ncbi:unnamed protein product [Clonostachys rosea]|uniref:HAUS augmin-like complex subunit 3 N-terminal domain-containing protein n=1 Tax=Bionectria ochroleuca TaxID=29856 RepID=A0ABY6TUG3_BIOOC|nr:unnamed protein product [Clonostachys rosea]
MDAQLVERAESLILSAGRQYGINSERDAIRQALSDPDHGPAFAQWAITHLGPDNLLTPDEMSTYTTLDKTGQVDRLAALHDLAEVQAVSEDDIRAAIDELNRSTEAISKQTETLRQQQDAFSRLIKKASDSSARRETFEAERQRKAITEHKYVSAEVEDLAQSVGFRVSELKQQGDESGHNLNATVEGILASDDKLLSSLQKLGWELDQQDPEEAGKIDKLREISIRLIKITVETLRTKLDRVYLEALTNAERSGEARATTVEEVRALEEELESLYSEIFPVAQMSVEQQYLDPASKSIGGRSGQSLQRSVAAFTYVRISLTGGGTILQCLDYLNDRGERLKQAIDTFRSHQATSTSIISMAKDELSAPDHKPRRSMKPVVPISPVRKAPTARPRGNTDSRSRRRSSGIMDEPPIETLLQNLAILFPIEAETSSDAKIAVLKRVLAERTAKESDVALSLQESFEATASSHLNDVALAIQLLKDTVLAESPYNEVNLVDSDIESSISVLQSEVRQLVDELERADAKKIAIKKSEKKEELVKRWAN